MSDHGLAQGSYAPSDEFIAQAHVDAAGYATRYAASVADPVAFWRAEGQRIDWIKDYTKVKDSTFELGRCRSSGSRMAR